MTNRVLLPKPLTFYVRKEILGTEEDVKGQVIAIESYSGSIPTFTWLSDSGHLYFYLPSTAFGLNRSLTEVVDFICPDDTIVVSDLKIDNFGYGLVGDLEIKWKKYIATIDWPLSNACCHIVLDYNNSLVILRNPRFQIGGERLNRPKWKKLRSVWNLNE